MDCGGHGRRPLLGMTPMVLLVLGLYLQGSASRCIDTVLGEDLQPLPPSVQRCSLPSGLLQPDIAPPGQGGISNDGGDTRIVGGSPATSGSYGGGSSDARPTPQGGNQFGRPDRPGQYGRPVFGGSPGQYGGGTRQNGPVGAGKPAQYGAYSGPYRGCCGGGSSSGYGTGYSAGNGPIYKNPQGNVRPVWKAPDLIPHIPSLGDRAGARIPLPKDSQYNPYGGGASTYSGGGGASTYSGGGGASGPGARYAGSYGPQPFGLQPGPQGGRYSGYRGPPCNPSC